jgi:hypothetical protein
MRTDQAMDVTGFIGQLCAHRRCADRGSTGLVKRALSQREAICGFGRLCPRAIDGPSYKAGRAALCIVCEPSPYCFGRSAPAPPPASPSCRRPCSSCSHSAERQRGLPPDAAAARTATLAMPSPATLSPRFGARTSPTGEAAISAQQQVAHMRSESCSQAPVRAREKSKGPPQRRIPGGKSLARNTVVRPKFPQHMHIFVEAGLHNHATLAGQS